MAHDHLFSLPNEIIHRTVDILDPGDLVSFILTSKTAHSLSESAIRQHQVFLKDYSKLQFGYSELWCSMYKPAGHYLVFLDEILQNPRIAWYPRSIEAAKWDFDSPGDSDDEDDAQESKVAHVVSSRRSELSAFGAGNSWITGEERRAEWRDALLNYSNQHHHLAMLLTMLPNLRSIKLISMDSGSEPLREMVWAIAAANRDPESPLHGHALGKLMKVDIGRDEHKYGEDITLYAPFIALPSVRSVYGDKIADGYSELPGHSFGHDMEFLRPRQIEEINIEYSAIEAQSWAWLLGNIDNLKRFTFDHADAVIGYARFACGQIVELLKEHASHSLVRLDITAASSFVVDGFGWEYGDHFVEDLKAFKNLRVLRLMDTAFQKGEAGEIVRLADVLPASIRIVKIVERIEEGDLADLFRGLAEAKKDNLPELKKVILEGDYNIWKDMYDEITAAGVEITGWGLDVI